MRTAPLRRAGILMLLGVLGAAPRLADAGPWEVGSSRPAQQRKLKFALEHKRSASARSWTAPKLKLALPLAQGLSMELSESYAGRWRRGASARRGPGDASIKLGWGWRDEREAGVDLMLEPKLTLDTGHEGVGAGTNTLKLPLRVGRSLGRWHLTGELRYTRDFSRHDKDQAGYGLLLEYRSAQHWTLGADLFQDHPPQHGRQRHLLGELGFKIKAGRNGQWQALAGRSLENRRGPRESRFKVEFAYAF